MATAGFKDTAPTFPYSQRDLNVTVHTVSDWHHIHQTPDLLTTPKPTLAQFTLFLPGRLMALLTGW